MEPLSLAASCAGLISLAVQITQLGLSYVHNVSAFGEDLHAIVEEVIQLNGLLSAIHPMLQDVTQINCAALVRSGDLEACNTTLTQILDALYNSFPRPQQPLRNLKRRLDWPLKKHDIKQLLDKLERHKSTLKLGLVANET